MIANIILTASDFVNEILQKNSCVIGALQKWTKQMVDLATKNYNYDLFNYNMQVWCLASFCHVAQAKKNYCLSLVSHSV